MNADVAEEFDQHENRDDGKRVVDGLTGGLSLLSDSLYLRLHADVERIVGADSMLMPVSEMKSKQLTWAEIERYQIAESTVAVQDRGYVNTNDDWYMRWLMRLRLGETSADQESDERLADYLSKTPDERRLAFTNVLVGVLPGSRQAPLVLFRLFPLSVQIVTALAFGDHPTASDVRTRQTALLPAIVDCRQCRGEVLQSAQQCPECGNPVWKSEYLRAAD